MRLLASLPLLLLAACVTRPVQTLVPSNMPDFAVAVSTDSTILLRNLSAEPVYFAVLEQEFSTRARWAPCTAPSECPRIDAEGQVRVPYSAVTGYQPGARAVVIYWYKLSPGGRPGEVNSRTVVL